MFLDYIGIGFTHIVPKGLDHILFVVGLLPACSPRLKPLLIQITAFTVAHSVTLALAMLGVDFAARQHCRAADRAARSSIIAIENLATNRLSSWRPSWCSASGCCMGWALPGC